MGYNDLGANGNPDIKTPNLNRMADDDVRFTRHYTDSTCTASRIGIMTGAPRAQQGFRPDNIGLPPELVTLPEILRDAGYTTHHIGQWHLGFASRLAWPTAQGFDSFFGFLNQFLLRNPVANGSWAFSRPTYRDPWLQEDEQLPQPYKGHLSAIPADRAVSLIESKAPGDAPWFLNFWTYAPHTPIQPMAQYYADNPAGRYRAFIEQVDATVGRIVNAVESQGLAGNTLLLVASDNGGTNQQIDNNAPFFGTKASFYEGGVRTPLLIRWPGKIPAGQVHEGIVSNFDYLPTFTKAASATTPPGLVGSDLVELVHNPQTMRPDLYWESGNSQHHSLSMLSGDGRWRVTQHFSGQAMLFNLDSHPAGNEDVAPEHPEVIAAMHDDFIAWRQQQRVIAMDYKRQNEQGQGLLTGSSPQRIPGYAGHSFAIGVTPAVLEDDTEQIIAQQAHQWTLSQREGRLRVSLQGLELEGPAPLPGQCASVIVASHF